MTLPIYKEADMYALAFSFVSGDAQVDRLEAYIREYGRIPVRRVLDVCCGPSVELPELARRGYTALGLDASAEMLAYLKHKAEAAQVVVETMQGDMRDFTLAEPVDFAFIMMGSFMYVSDTDGLLAHLACLGKALNPGGLYLIENMELDWANLFGPAQTWTMEREGVSVETTSHFRLVNALEQTICHRLAFQVNERGAAREIVEESVVRLFFPQEFKSLVETQGLFELVGFFERFTTKPLADAKADNVVLLRKK